MSKVALKCVGLSKKGSHIFNYCEETVLLRRRLPGEVFPGDDGKVSFIVVSPDDGEVLAAYELELDFWAEARRQEVNVVFFN